MILLAIYYLLPTTGLSGVSSFSAAVAGLSIGYCVPQAEAFKQFFEPLLDKSSVARPPEAIGALCSNFAFMIRDSSLAYVIGTAELMRVGQQSMMETFDLVPPLALMALFYLSTGLVIIYVGKLIGWLFLRNGQSPTQ